MPVTKYRRFQSELQGQKFHLLQGQRLTRKFSWLPADCYIRNK